MKNYKVILISLLAAIGITLLSGFKFIAYLRTQNSELAANINLVTNRITALELDKTMKQISVLKAKNAALLKEIEGLKTELMRVSHKTPKTSSQKAGSVGNKGFLLKEGLPTR